VADYNRTITPRGYQQLILDLIQLHTQKRKSIILELDCGMGKRVITYELLTRLFPDKRILLIVLSSSSLHETSAFLQHEYGGVNGFNWLGPGISGSFARKILTESRVVLCTPQKLANILTKNPEIARTFDIVIINEIDKIVRRMGSRRVLVYPWSTLLELFTSSLIIGMSGTLRDSHYVLDNEQLEIRKELNTLLHYLPNSELIYMDSLAGTDIRKFTKVTSIELVGVEDPTISNLSNIITDELKEAYREIKEALKVEAPDYLAQLSEIGPQALLQAPVSLELRSKAQTLALIRKYLFSMVPSQLKKFLHPPLPIDSSMLPTTPQKILKVVELAKKTKKIVVLCSYLKTARTIVAYLQRVNIKAFLITGKVLDKNAILQQFREYAGQAAIVMSPVGERDIDLPEAEQLIIFDSVRTTKTVYQQLKRIRGGTGVFLYYANSYEARKVKSIVKSIIEKYPWSIEVNSPMP